MSGFVPGVPGGSSTAVPPYLTAGVVPGTVVAPASTLSDFDNFNPQPLAADGFQGNVTTFPSIGSGIYHAASPHFFHPFSRGIYVRANYSFSKNIDNAPNELFSSRVNPPPAPDRLDFNGQRGISAR